MREKFKSVLYLGTTIVTAYATQAGAQTTEANGRNNPLVLPPVVVTGQQVTRAIEDTPTSVVVLRPKENLDGSLTDLRKATEQVPNVATFSGDRGIAIRGIGQTGFGLGTTSFPLTRSPNDLITSYVNGIPVSVFAGFDSLWDIEQIEFFRGTQSTTFGRGAPAGAVVRETTTPNGEWSGEVRGVGGSQRTFGSSGALGGSLGDAVAFRIAADYSTTDGFTKNRTTGNPESIDDNFSTSGKLLIEPSGNFDALLSAVHWNRSVGTSFADGGLYPNDQAVLSNERDIVENKGAGGSARLSYTFSDAARLESNTAFIKETANRRFDIDQLPFAIASGSFKDDIQTSTQELRLHLSPFESVRGFVGVYGEDFNGDSEVRAGAFGSTFQDVESTTYAVFGEAEIDVTSSTLFTLGARYQHEESDTSVSNGTSTVNSSAEADAFLPKISLQQDVVPGFTVFAKAERGFRAGGGGGSILTGRPFEFGPEFTWNYDAGFRSVFAGGQVRVNANVFFVQFEDQQLEIPSGSGLPGDTVTANVGSSELYGLELDADYLVSDEFTVFTRLGLLETEFTSNNIAAAALKGNDFSFAPRTKATVGADYKHISGAFFAASATYSSSFFSDAANSRIDKVSGRTTVDVGTGYDADDWKLSASVSNLFDSDYLLTSNRAITFVNPGGAVVPGDGRAFRFEVARRF